MTLKITDKQEIAAKQRADQKRKYYVGLAKQYANIDSSLITTDESGLETIGKMIHHAQQERKLDKVEQFSPSVASDRIEGLKNLFPECFTEGKIDFEKLREVLGEGIEEGTERYNFTWTGKRDAIRSLQTPTPATLVPCREESVDFETTGNIFIEGDNLEVLKLLYKPYFGRVKAIYIDPPYNTGQRFCLS